MPHQSGPYRVEGLRVIRYNELRCLSVVRVIDPLVAVYNEILITKLFRILQGYTAFKKFRLSTPGDLYHSEISVLGLTS